jgi:fibronectin-binding autotransporter adhesin
VKKSLFRIAGVLAALAAPLAISTAAHAANFTWTGLGTPNGSGNLVFSDNANWNSPPTIDGTASLTFPKSAQSDKIYNDFTAGTVFAGMNFSVDGTATGVSCPATTNTKISGNDIGLVGAVSVSVSPAGTVCYYYPTVDLNITAVGDITQTGVVNGSVTIGSSTARTLALGSHMLAIDRGSILANITGSGTINATGSSYMSLDGDNSTYTGPIFVAAGASLSVKAKSLGASAGTTTVSSGGTLILCSQTGVLTIYSEPITIGGTGVASYGALSAQACLGGGGPIYTPRDVEIAGPLTLTSNTTVSSLDNITVSGPLSGNFTLVSLPGATGALKINSSANTSATQNGDQAVQKITTTYSDDKATELLSVGQNEIAIVTGKRGDTDVFGILKGTGTLGVLNVQKEGHLAPGQSPGCINTGNLTLAGTYDVELGGLTVCTQYDQTKVTGIVNLTGGTLNVIRYNNMVPRLNNSFTIIDNDGADAVTGTFTGLAQGATTTVDGITYTVSYTGGTGNDVVLTVTGVSASLGAPNTGFLALKASVILPMLAVLAGSGVVAMQYATAKRKK